MQILKLQIGNLEEIFEIREKLEIILEFGKKWNLKKSEVRGKNWKLGKNIRNSELNLGWKMIIGNILDIWKKFGKLEKIVNCEIFLEILGKNWKFENL